MALLATLVALPVTAGEDVTEVVEKPAPSGTYANLGQGKLYWYDADSGNLTYLEECPVERCTTNASKGQDGQCLYSGDWKDFSTLYLSYGTCVSVAVERVSEDVWRIIARKDAREVVGNTNPALHENVRTYRWLDAEGDTLDSGKRRILWPNATLLDWGFARLSLNLTQPDAAQFCARNEHYRDGVLVRDTKELCTPV